MRKNLTNKGRGTYTQYCFAKVKTTTCISALGRATHNEAREGGGRGGKRRRDKKKKKKQCRSREEKEDVKKRREEGRKEHKRVDTPL